tara:strand:- start:256 stop:540 length:285 start_codon:yes stop_codon:yes gene_type:complete
MEYYIFNTEEEAFNKNADIYDMYTVQPRNERVTLYCYPVFSNNEDFAMSYDGSYNAKGLLDGLTPITEEEAIEQGYNLDEPIMPTDLTLINLKT